MGSLIAQQDTLITEAANTMATTNTIGINFDSVKEALWDMVISFGPRVLLAILVLILGLWLIKLSKKVLNKALQTKRLDDTARKFIVDITGGLLAVMLFISVLSLFGVPTTSFVAILGAGGLAIGLALQGALQNFAGGVLILLFNPYRIGHLVEIMGSQGFVKDIRIFNTTIVTLDNKRVTIPNGPLINQQIINFSEEGSIRVELFVNVAYDTDLKDAIETIGAALETDSKILKTPAPEIGVAELGDSSIKLFVRPYTKAGLYWQVHMEALKSVCEALQKRNIKIPFPQHEVRIKKDQ
ncbi:mechanosensitive ion channel family protein [Flavobacteriales bacterium]|nr:mechanosensitive ion channel family protein [Flavobacteriales bacterium]MDC3337203.1 mechanosensitive ion channel family protein [Flavobacteriales bacterium]